MPSIGPKAFNETVKLVAQRIGQGHILLTERVRAGRRRQISVGPHRKAVGPREYALCVLPALPDSVDCQQARNLNKTAREFVRLVGTENARDALRRESRKREG